MPYESQSQTASLDSVSDGEPRKLSRRLGLFDATMIVMGGIIGSGIFMNPHVVAEVVHSPAAILGAWAVGGLIALAGAFIYAELAALRPQVGGQYAYIREALHPGLAFIYGWTLLLVVQTGGMAAVAVTFARYFIELTHTAIDDRVLAATALAVLTVVNCLGVRAGSVLQSVLMVLKIAAIVALIGFGLGAGTRHSIPGNQSLAADGWTPLTAFGAALVPVLFAYGGWQTANFIAGEIREPRRNLPRALVLGVIGVVLLYLAVNYVCVSVLGVQTLAATKTPASEVMRLALGEKGARLIAVGIALSTLGFLSQGMLTAPRVYFAMASDGLFFKRVAWLHPRTRVPIIAIAVQGSLAIVIAVAGAYEQILNYVVSIDSLFFGVTAACLFGLRRKAAHTNGTVDGMRHSLRVSSAVIILFIAAEWLVAASAIYKDPANSAIGVGILLAGIPVYFFWPGRRERDRTESHKGV